MGGWALSQARRAQLSYHARYLLLLAGEMYLLLLLSYYDRVYYFHGSLNSLWHREGNHWVAAVRGNIRAVTTKTFDCRHDFYFASLPAEWGKSVRGSLVEEF